MTGDAARARTWSALAPDILAGKVRGRIVLTLG